MNTTSRKQNTLIIVWTCIIIVLLGAWYVIYMQMEKTGNTISTLTQAQASANERDAQIRNMTLSVDSITSDVSQVHAHIIAPDGEVSFLEEVENLAKTDGLDAKVDTVDVSQAPNLSAAGLEYLNVKLTVVGTWSALFQFLSVVEHMPYDITVSQSDVSDVSDNVKGATQWQGDFQIGVIKQQSPTE